MVTILLEKILSLLEGWAGSFASFIIDLMSKLDLIETETANLPDIKTNTDNISSNTDSMTATLTNIKTDTGVISGKVNNIDSNTTIIKNNINTISTNVGTASAFCEDTANNTLEIVDKITTIASDTTQLRTNSNSISSDVSEIKNTLGLYLYNTIVTEDSEGSIANFDTDLKDYLQEAKVTIPADAGGISEAKIGYVDFNQLIKNGNFSNTLNWTVSNDLSFTVDDNKGILTANNNVNNYASIYTSISIPADHVCMIFALITSNKQTQVNINTNNGVIRNITLTPNTLTDFSRAFKTASNNTYFQIYVNRTSTLAENDYVIIQNVMILDLTVAFGDAIANAIYSLSNRGENEIKSIFNKPYYNYNSGGSFVSVESVNGSYYPNANISFGSSITDGGELDLVTGLLKVNTTPATFIQCTPAPIRTLKGLNSIWADVGDISVTYRETLKHYLEKQNS